MKTIRNPIGHALHAERFLDDAEVACNAAASRAAALVLKLRAGEYANDSVDIGSVRWHLDRARADLNDAAGCLDALERGHLDDG